MSTGCLSEAAAYQQSPKPRWAKARRAPRVPTLKGGARCFAARAHLTNPAGMGRPQVRRFCLGTRSRFKKTNRVMSPQNRAGSCPPKTTSPSPCPIRLAALAQGRLSPEEGRGKRSRGRRSPERLFATCQSGDWRSRENHLSPSPFPIRLATLAQGRLSPTVGRG